MSLQLSISNWGTTQYVILSYVLHFIFSDFHNQSISQFSNGNSEINFIPGRYAISHNTSYGIPVDDNDLHNDKDDNIDNNDDINEHDNDNSNDYNDHNNSDDEH